MKKHVKMVMFIFIFISLQGCATMFGNAGPDIVKINAPYQGTAIIDGTKFNIPFQTSLDSRDNNQILIEKENLKSCYITTRQGGNPSAILNGLWGIPLGFPIMYLIDFATGATTHVNEYEIEAILHEDTDCDVYYKPRSWSDHWYKYKFKEYGYHAEEEYTKQNNSFIKVEKREPTDGIPLN